jgi:hypothetical protein
VRTTAVTRPWWTISDRARSAAPPPGLIYPPEIPVSAQLAGSAALAVTAANPSWIPPCSPATTACSPRTASTGLEVTKARRGRGARRPEDSTPAERRASIIWAQPLKRVFKIDIETCSACGGAMRIVACIEDPASTIGSKPSTPGRE